MNVATAQQSKQVLPTIETVNKCTYTVDEIQNILGVGLTTAYKLIKQRQFHSVRVGHRIIISKKSFDEWLGM